MRWNSLCAHPKESKPDWGWRKILSETEKERERRIHAPVKLRAEAADQRAPVISARQSRLPPGSSKRLQSRAAALRFRMRVVYVKIIRCDKKIHSTITFIVSQPERCCVLRCDLEQNRSKIKTASALMRNTTWGRFPCRQNRPWMSQPISIPS